MPLPITALIQKQREERLENPLVRETSASLQTMAGLFVKIVRPVIEVKEDER